MRGRFPSFSPDGVDARVRASMVMCGSSRLPAETERRLVRGGAPAWSPSGADGSHTSLREARSGSSLSHGGRPQRVNSVHGTALDWQPLPATRLRNPCTPSTGINRACLGQWGGCVLAARLVRLRVSSCAWPRVGCRRTTATCYCGPVTAVRLAGRFAALQSENGKPPTVARKRHAVRTSAAGKATPLASVWLQTRRPEIRCTPSTP